MHNSTAAKNTPGGNTESRRATAMRRRDGGHQSMDRGCWAMDGVFWFTFHISKGQSKSERFDNVSWSLMSLVRKKKISKISIKNKVQSQRFYEVGPVCKPHGPEEWSMMMFGLMRYWTICKRNHFSFSCKRHQVTTPKHSVQYERRILTLIIRW